VNQLIEYKKAFGDIEFFEEGHSYYRKGKKLVSVTTVLDMYKQEFREDYWLKYKTLQAQGLSVKSDASRGVKPDHILIGSKQVHKDSIKLDVSVLRNEWKQDSDLGKENGSIIHKYMEDGFKGKFPLIRKEVCDKFIRDHWNLYPLFLEIIVGDDVIAGQADGLFGSFEGKTLLLDYKTDKEIERFNRFQNLKEPLLHLSDCNFVKYGLQMNMYRHFIETYTSIVIDELYIVHIRPDDYDMIRIEKDEENIKLILNDFRRRIKHDTE
jgi:hypothetical protein